MISETNSGPTGSGPTRPQRKSAGTGRKRATAKTKKGDGAQPSAAAAASAVVAARHAAQHADIAREAYYRAERRGFAPGYELDDWLAAEVALNGGAPHASIDDPAGSDGTHYRPDHEI